MTGAIALRVGRRGRNWGLFLGIFVNLVYFKAPERHCYNPITNATAIRVSNGDEDSGPREVLLAGFGHSLLGPEVYWKEGDGPWH